MAERSPLRIGVDARELCGTPTGAGRYLFELLDRWRLRPDAGLRHVVLYVPDAARAGPGLLAPLAGTPGFDVRAVAGLGGTFWEQAQVPRVANRDRLDVFFAPAYSAPLAVTAPLVLVVHDLSYMAHPEWFRWLGGLRRRALTRWSARKAVRVLTVSEFSAREIERYLDVPRRRLDVILHGLPSVARFASAEGPPLVSEPLVLYAGSIFNRRHVPDLVRAFAALARRRADARLVIAGENRSYPREEPAGVASSLGVADRVSVRSYVSDAELGDLYARARAFAFLSEYEGFGLTPLEALALGVPAVVYDTPVAREIYGAAAVYAAPGRLEQVTGALERLLYDAGARADLLAHASPVLARYSWDRAADETLAAIERAASEGATR